MRTSRHSLIVRGHRHLGSQTSTPCASIIVAQSIQKGSRKMEEEAKNAYAICRGAWRNRVYLPPHWDDLTKFEREMFQSVYLRGRDDQQMYDKTGPYRDDAPFSEQARCSQ
jgi:hypothetical protein